MPADRQLYQLGGSCNSGKYSRQRAAARQFQNGLLMNIRPQRFSARRQPHQQVDDIHRRQQARHVGQQQPERRIGGRAGHQTRRHYQRGPTAAQDPKPGQCPAAGFCTFIMVVRAAVLVVAVQVFFKVVQIGALLFAVRHYSSPVRS